MSSVKTPARVRFPRSNVTGRVPEAIAPGSLAVNWADKKLHVGDASNNAMLISQMIEDWTTARSYRTGDYVIRDLILYRAKRDRPAGTAFAEADWERIGDEVRARYAEPYSTGLISGGLVTQIAVNRIQIAAGTGVVVNNTNPVATQITPVSWPLFVLTVGDKAEPWTAIGINQSGVASEVLLGVITDEWRRKNVLLAYILWDDIAAEITDLIDGSLPSGGTAAAVEDAYFAEGGAFRAQGLRIGAGAGLGLSLTAGTIFDLGVNWRANPYQPNTIALPASNPVALTLVNRVGVISEGAALDPTKWDSAGTLTAVPAGSATIQYVSLTPDGTVYVQYGQTVYGSINAALAALPSDWEGLSGYTVDGPIIVLAALAMASNATSTATDIFITVANNRGDPFDQGSTAAGDTSQFLLLDGSRPMVGPLQMNGRPITGADINGGTTITVPTVAPDSKIRLRNSAVEAELPATTTAADRGEVLVNSAARKLWLRSPTGAPISIAYRIGPFSTARPYEQNDIAIFDSGLWSANTTLAPGAWNAANWTSLGGSASGDPILKVPAGASTNTINTTGQPARRALVLDGDPAQTANLLEVPGTNPNDTRSLVIDSQGFPNARFGPNIFRVSQPAHPFGFVGQPATFNNGIWGLASAATIEARAVAVVEQIIDPNIFVLRTGGLISGLQTGAFAGGVIAVETVYYVSDTDPGRLTSTASTIRPDPVLYTTVGGNAIVIAGAGSSATDFVRKTGDTMTGPLTLAGAANSLRFETDQTAIYKSTSTPSILVAIGGTAVARIDEATTTADYNETVITKLKGDNRYLRPAQPASVTNLTATGTLTVTGASTFNDPVRINAGSATVPALTFNSAAPSGDGMSWVTGDGAYFFENNAVVAHLEAGSTATQAKSLLTKEMGEGLFIQESERAALLNTVFDTIYPVGSIYIGTSATNPGTLLGRGTWAAFGQGRALVGVGTADGVAWTVNQLQGAAAVALSIANLPSHNHTADPPSATTSENTHNHGSGTYTAASAGSHTHAYDGARGGTADGLPTNGFSGGDDLDTANMTGRIKSAGTHTHDVTGSSGDITHSHTVNIAAFNTGSTGSGTEHSNIQPSVGVYMWRRTA